MSLKISAAKIFFGRTNELEILQSIALEAEAGDATSTFLSGGRGIGKTELLRQAFNLLWQQEKAVPFFYAINTLFTSAQDFSRDYLCRFILQSLAFLKKDPSMINAGFYSLEDLLHLAKRLEAHWAVDIIDGYLQVKSRGDPVNIFLSAISAPYHSHLSTGTPVVVMIDNFDQIRRFYGSNVGDNKKFWMLFEDSIKSRYAPHIITGFQEELYEMFFYETSLGNYLDLITLPCLNKSISLKLFTSLCDAYALDVEADLPDFIDLFNGNPFYIRNFVHSARKAGRILTSDELQKVYSSEITEGKIFLYWTSYLKKYLPFDVRRASLKLLYHLCEEGGTADPTGLADRLSISREDFDRIINLIRSSGIVEEGFSTLKVTDDKILIDVIKRLYHREILEEPLNRIKYPETDDKRQHIREVETPSFEITIPSTPGSERVAVKALEQVAQRHNIAPKTVGQLQVALIELFTNVIGREGHVEGNYHIRFKYRGNIFSTVVEIPQKEPILTGTDSVLKLIRPYIDDIKVEGITNGTRITLLKELREDTLISKT